MGRNGDDGFVAAVFGIRRTASAKSVRSAVVVEVSGDVTNTKSGGSRSNTVLSRLDAESGGYDLHRSGASAVLRIVDRNDELTIGENAEVYISELMEDGGAKKSKVKAWAGSMWSKVKSARQLGRRVRGGDADGGHGCTRNAVLHIYQSVNG
ncbi:hypothetical protein [Paenibacillus validus]|uniref:hypothetical protein n=1 Tax=Paenibacillus validus TaxID=44253 RepID=UPI003D2E89BD